MLLPLHPPNPPLLPPLSFDQEHVGWVDASNLAGGVAAGLVLGGVGEVPAACVMLFDIGVDAYVIVQRVLFQ